VLHQLDGHPHSGQVTSGWTVVDTVVGCDDTTDYIPDRLISPVIKWGVAVKL